MSLDLEIDIPCPYCDRNLERSAMVGADVCEPITLKFGDSVYDLPLSDWNMRHHLNRSVYEPGATCCKHCKAVIDTKHLFENGVYKSASIVRWYKTFVDPSALKERKARRIGYYGRTLRELPVDLPDLIFVEVVVEPGLIARCACDVEWLIDFYSLDELWTDINELIDLLDEQVRSECPIVLVSDQSAGDAS